MSLVFERPVGGDLAVLVHASFDAAHDESDHQEFNDLVSSTGATIVETFVVRRSAADSKYLIGTGKVDEIAQMLQAHPADVVVFSHTLSPSQERNLERAFKCRVLDRTGLILDIFAQRARSHEGKLQVELAQLRHMSTRLIRGWTHLERQKGGIGMRGPGEKQLETDRRLLNVRIKTLLRRLDKVSSQRNQGRQARQKAEIPTISLVGYTNAGKSTLFNKLSGAEVYAADQLFATLDPTLRRVDLPGGLPVILADTVGFIRHLPHDVVAAFRATLQETEEADLLLHIVDANDPNREDNINSVNEVLENIGVEDKPQILVFNKIDVSDLDAHSVEANSDGAARVWLSAMTGDGANLLFDLINAHFQGSVLRGTISLPPSAGDARAALFRHEAVVAERFTDDGQFELDLCLARGLYQQLASRYKVLPNMYSAFGLEEPVDDY